MITEQHNELLIELRAIRAALEIKPRAIATASSVNTSNATSLPPPDQMIEGAASVTVHFGKNKGVAIGSLTEKQLLWYGADREPQLKNDGTAFPPRAEDTLLKNACRTVWMQRTRGIAVDSKMTLLNKPVDIDEVPF
jgi:hypothetical protein